MQTGLPEMVHYKERSIVLFGANRAFCFELQSLREDKLSK